MTSDRRLLVLDDDPTGSQCVAGVEVAFDTDPAVAAQVLAEVGSTCFVLTNSRALDEVDAVALNRRIVGGVVDLLADRGALAGLHVVSRSDSTLRGHVVAEPTAVADSLAEHGIEVDAFVFCPAMIEAGRFTEDDVHYAKVDGVPTRVEDTDFARDATFGYTRSNLREFLEERSDGAVRAGQCLSVSLADIREGGVDRVIDVLRGARGRTWVVVNATDYADMDVVAEAMARLEAEGRVFVTRCGPSFVRSLAGQSGATVLGPEDIRTSGERAPHGVVVVGSHVGLTSTQLRVLQERGAGGETPLREFELQVPRLLDDTTRADHVRETVEGISAALASSDCVVYTSRDLVRTDSKQESLAIARRVSDAVVAVARGIRDARPAWVVAKGGITSHEVAASGMEIRRARVAGQFYAGQISMFTATDAPADVLGVPYVVFPGNVGGREALAEVVQRLRDAGRADERTEPGHDTKEHRS